MGQKVHIPNFKSLPNCDFIALAEVRKKLGRKVQERYNVPRFYKSHVELAEDKDVEAVGVSAHPALQGEIARDLLAAGKNVFMEKPMAVSVDQAKKILAAAKSSGARLMVAYMKRYDAGNELVKNTVQGLVSRNELGKIILVRNHGFRGSFERAGNLDTPIETTDEPKTIPRKFGPSWIPKDFLDSYLFYSAQYCHNVNLLRWFLDAKDDVKVKLADFDDDANVTGIVVFDMKGTRATMETGKMHHYYWDEETDIYFEHGWVKTWAPPLLLKNMPAKVEIYRAGKTQEFIHPIPKPMWTWSYKREAEHFVECVISGEEFRSSGQDSLTDVRIFEDIYRTYLKQQGLLKK